MGAPHAPRTALPRRARKHRTHRYAATLVEDVEFSCEDACRSDKDLMCEVLKEVIKAGARTLNIPDTVGFTTPQEYQASAVWRENPNSNSYPNPKRVPGTRPALCGARPSTCCCPRWRAALSNLSRGAGLVGNDVHATSPAARCNGPKEGVARAARSRATAHAGGIG